MIQLRTLAAAVALTLGAGLATVAVEAPTGTAAPAHQAVHAKKKAKKQARKTGQRVKIDLLPPISGVGRKPVSADRAKVVVTGKFKPGKLRRPVVLQRKAGKKWVKAGKARQPKNGAVQFNAAYLVKGKPVTYRLVSKGAGLKKTVSKKVSTSKWAKKQLFSDEFSGNALSEAWATREQDFGHVGVRSCSRTDAANTTVGGNVVRLVVAKDTAKPGRCSYAGKSHAWRTNAMVGTEGAFAFKYGYAAARVKFNSLRGQHFGFWLQPQSRAAEHGSAKQTGAEIDVIEWFGDKHPSGGLSSYVHYAPKPGASVKIGSWIKKPQRYGKAWSKKYHVFSMKWTPKGYTFYIDGKVSSVIKKAVSGREQFLILSQLSSDYQLHYLKNEGKLPQGSSVDWVRVWGL